MMCGGLTWTRRSRHICCLLTVSILCNSLLFLYHLDFFERPLLLRREGQVLETAVSSRVKVPSRVFVPCVNTSGRIFASVRNTSQRFLEPRLNITSAMCVSPVSSAMEIPAHTANTANEISKPRVNTTRGILVPSMNTTKGIPVPSMNTTKGIPVPSMNTTKGIPVPSMNATKGIPVPSMNTTKGIPVPSMNTTMPERAPMLNTTLCITLGHIHGRVGNHMFQYAALLGIAAMNNRSNSVLLPTTGQLSSIFTGCLAVRRGLCHNPTHLSFSRYAIYNPATRSLPHVNVSLEGYFQSWKYFHHIKPTILNGFSLRDGVKRRAKELLGQCTLGRENVTTVGVHVRRRDMLRPGRQRYGFRVPGLSYFLQASRYFRYKYDKVIFIVVSDDSDWCRQNLTSPDFVIADDAPWREHFGLLTLCDHVIMTVGTFGWWAGYLAGGEVVYFSNEIAEKSAASKSFRKKDYYLPHWVGLNG